MISLERGLLRFGPSQQPLRAGQREADGGGIRRTPRGIAREARNTTAVEPGNTTFWFADETSRDGGVGLAPGSRWRCGRLR